MTSPTPARVSGPGALSQRTDGGQPIRHITDAKYGEDRDFIAQQKMAPLAEATQAPVAGGLAMPAPPPTQGPPPSPEGPPQPITPFSAPTADPSQPVTTGALPFGAPQPPPQVTVQPNQISQSLAPYFAADTSGVLAEFAWKLSQMGL